MDSPLTTLLRIEAWPDAVIDGLGHAPTSAYFEWLWLPQIGPSAAWAYRRLTSGLTSQPDGYQVSLPELAQWLGLSGGISKNGSARCGAWCCSTWPFRWMVPPWPCAVGCRR